MNNIRDLIEQKKAAIAYKKQKLKEQITHSKQNFSNTTLYNASLIGTFILGYIFVPRRLGRFLFKSLSYLSTYNYIKELFQPQLAKIYEKTEIKDITPKNSTRKINHKPQKIKSRSHRKLQTHKSKSK